MPKTPEDPTPTPIFERPPDQPYFPDRANSPLVGQVLLLLRIINEQPIEDPLKDANLKLLTDSKQPAVLERQVSLWNKAIAINQDAHGQASQFTEAIKGLALNSMSTIITNSALPNGYPINPSSLKLALKTEIIKEGLSAF